MAVFVLDKHHKPLMPCSEKRARQLLERNRARVHKMHPFTIRLVDRLIEDSIVSGVVVKIDPGSKQTGIAVVRPDDNGTQHAQSYLCLNHRGTQIHKKMGQRANYRRRRRSQNLRYRAARFDNRKRRQEWLPPSLEHRAATVLSWMRRLKKIAPIQEIHIELVRFDTQKLQNPEITGLEYQHGDRFGYETKEYLLEKWGRECAYCGKKDVPLEVEHIVPKAHGGSNRVSNLTISCHVCNQKKADRPIQDFLKENPTRLKKILLLRKQSLRDAAAVNATRWSLFNRLKLFGFPIQTGSGGQTKWNRHRLHVPKEHWLDALCVGSVAKVTGIHKPVLHIQCKGRGSHQRTRSNAFGFPIGYCMRQKRIHGFATGDIVFACVTKGKNAGSFRGRVSVRKTGSFDIQTVQGKKQGVSWKYCRLICKNDGYSYILESGTLQTSDCHSCGVA